MKRLLGFIIIAGLMLPVGALAEEAKLYKYVDDQGVTRFTDSMEAVPEQYRSNMKQADAVVSEPSSETTPAPAPETTQTPELSKEDMAKAQQKAEYEELKELEQELSQQLEQLDEDLSRAAKRKSKSGKDKYEWKQLKQQKEELEQEIEKATDRMVEIEPAE